MGDEKILLSYRYDISEMIDDIMQLFFALQKSDSGEWFVDWTPNTFASNWKFKWLKNCLEIEVNWREEFNATNYLKKNNVLKIDKDIFLNGWRKITKVIQVNFHPLYGKDRGFVNAGELQAGDELVSVDSGTCIVENVYIEI